MKLIKIDLDHYIITNGKAKTGCYAYTPRRNCLSFIGNEAEIEYDQLLVTHSTQPIGNELSSIRWYDFNKISLQEVEELIGESPDSKLIDAMSMRYRHDFGLLKEEQKNRIRITMRQLWEEVVGLGFYEPDDKDNRYTEKQLKEVIIKAWYNGAKQSFEGRTFITDNDQDEIIKSIKSKTEWDVKFVNGKLKLK